MTVTTKHLKNNKIKIYADGEELFTVPAVIWYSSQLTDEGEATEEQLTQLKLAGETALASECGMRLLSQRAHSEYELKQKLSVRFSKEAALSAIDRFRELGLVDDEKFALMFAEELYSRKGFSEKRILLELSNRGIDTNYALNAVNALDINPEIGIIKIIEKYSLTEESTPKEKHRVIRRLINMGYSYSDISKYINIYE